MQVKPCSLANCRAFTFLGKQPQFGFGVSQTSITVKKEKEKKMLKAVEIKWNVTDNVMDDEVYEILESLPAEIIIPEGMTDPDEISDWLSDETGYCHKGFRLVDQDRNDVDMA